MLVVYPSRCADYGIQVNAEAAALRRNARIMDEIDVTLSFASLAHEMRLVRPVLTDS